MDGALQASSPWRSGAKDQRNRSHNDQRNRSPDESGLLKAFKRLGIVSKSSLLKIHRNPSLQRPELEPAHGNGPSLQSLPPYLAHLAGQSRLPDAQPAVAFPIAQNHNSFRQNHRFQSSDPTTPPTQRLQSQSRPSSLPKPPDPAEVHPSSLLPGHVRLVSSASQPYPWELVPQPRPATDSLSHHHRPRQPGDSPLAPSVHANKATPSSVDVVTPARVYKTAQQSSPVSPISPSLVAGFAKNAADLPIAGQCWGIKQDGSRCTRKVRTGSSPSKTTAGANLGRLQQSKPSERKKGKSAADVFLLHNGESDGNNVDTALHSRRAGSSTSALSTDVEEVYCFQHVAEVNKTAGFYLPASHLLGSDQASYIQFRDWFGPVELNKHTQALLRRCMSQPPSDVDRIERGYIYIYELRDRSNATHLCLKVGRTVNVFRRLGQWRSQCQSKDPLLRAFLPASDPKRQGLLSGIDSPDAPAVPNSHKWERLVHLELQDIGYRVEDQCQDCGSKHREIFMIPRTVASAQEGFHLTVLIVQKWLRFTQILGHGNDHDS